MERKATMLRFPPELYERLIREAGERTMKTGKRVAVNDVVVNVIAKYFAGKDRAQRGPKK